MALQPWSELAGALLFIAMACFVHLEFDGSRRWLFGAVIAVLSGTLLAGWLDGGVAVAVNPRALAAARVGRPLAVEPGQGRWQLDHLRTALARLTLAPGLTLPELLIAEAPRLPRSLVVLAIAPDLGGGLGEALAALRRSGFEVGVVWIQRAGTEPAASSIPEGVPVYLVQDDTDLERLGAQAL
jgi:hypothetical protein